jgi:hypothetical protein
MGIQVSRYDISIDGPSFIRSMRGSPTLGMSARVGRISMEIIASGSDLDRLIDMLESITGQRPEGYEHAARTVPGLREATDVPMLSASDCDEMIGEVVE